jgi:hypothetical protein
MNKNKFFKIALIFAIILLIILVYFLFIDKTKAVKNSYYAVYLQTGDIYFGKLSRFPKLTLSDAWFLQASIDGKGNLNLMKYSGAVFGPEDKMEINKENVIWISKLRDDSEVINYIQGNIEQTLPEDLLEFKAQIK